jgi:hypothetical protein
MVVKIIVVAVVVITLVAVLGSLLLAYQVNQQYSIGVGEGVAAFVSRSFSNTYNEPTDVGLDIGYTARVLWDGKAIGVVGYGGKYVRIAGQNYWYTLIHGYGAKANNVCPWYAPITGAEIYDVKVLKTDGKYVRTIGMSYVEIDYRTDVEVELEKVLRVDLVPVNGRLRIPVSLREYWLYGNFAFYHGRSGWFQGCPTPTLHHYDSVDSYVYVATIP